MVVAFIPALDTPISCCYFAGQGGSSSHRSRLDGYDRSAVYEQAEAVSETASACFLFAFIGLVRGGHGAVDADDLTGDRAVRGRADEHHGAGVLVRRLVALLREARGVAGVVLLERDARPSRRGWC